MKVLPLLLALLMLNSCKDEEEQSISSTSENKQKVESFNIKALFSTKHTISKKQAENIALEFINRANVNGNGLKSSKSLSISSTIVRSKGNGLKSSCNKQDTLGYIVNFAGNNGFAYVCADDRVNSRVLAVFDEGNYETENTDTLVNSVYNMIDSYVSSSINEFDAKKDERLLLVEKAIKNGELDTNTTNNRLKKLYNCNCKALLKSKLSQDDKVMQTYLPVCTECGGFCNGKKVKPGCLTIALTQLYCFWYDSWQSKYCNNYRITSSNVIHEFVDSDYSFKNRIEAYNKDKGEATHYFYNKIKENGDIIRSDHYNTEMKFSGVNSFLSNQFSIEELPIESEIWTDKIAEFQAPLMVEGEGVNTLSHTWLVDAYIIQYDMTPSLVNNSWIFNYEKKYCYLHYNWGWGGSGNGYFLDDIFVNTFCGGLYDKDSFNSTLKKEFKIKKAWFLLEKNWPRKRPANTNGWHTF